MSGNIHGMVLSFLVRELRDYIPRVPALHWIKPWSNIFKFIKELGDKDFGLERVPHFVAFYWLLLLIELISLNNKIIIEFSYEDREILKCELYK